MKTVVPTATRSYISPRSVDTVFRGDRSGAAVTLFPSRTTHLVYTILPSLCYHRSLKLNYLETHRLLPLTLTGQGWHPLNIYELTQMVLKK